MRRVISLVFVAAVLATLVPVPALAQDNQVCRVEAVEGRWIEVCRQRGGGNGGGGGGGGGGPLEGYYSAVLRWENFGDPEERYRCWEVRFNHRPGQVPGEDGRWTYEEAYEVASSSWGDEFDPCPASEVPDPGPAIGSLWSSTAGPPEFDLHVAPGWALTGMPAYLEIEGPRSIDQSVGLPPPFDFDATLEASSTYTVDWGDGTAPVEGIDSSGGPWPDGDIVHTYAVAEPVTVTVTATWSGTWSAGPFSGDLPVIAMTEELPLEVRQLQAVRVAPGS